MIVENRPTHDEDEEDLTDINDVRNGVFAINTIHRTFDLRKVVVLKVCHIRWHMFDLTHPFPSSNLDSKSFSCHS